MLAHIPLPIIIFILSGGLLLLLLAVLFLRRFYPVNKPKKKRRPRPVYKAEVIYNPLIDQPIIQTTADFTFADGPQDTFLRRQFPKGKRISFEGKDYTINRHVKLPQNHLQYAYIIYFDETEEAGLPFFAEIHDHPLLDSVTCVYGGLIFAQLDGATKLLPYQSFTYLSSADEVFIFPVDKTVPNLTLTANMLASDRRKVLTALLGKYAALDHDRYEDYMMDTHLRS